MPATVQNIRSHAAPWAGAAADPVLEGIEPALLAGLVVEPAAGRLEFSHALIRDVLYEQLSRLRRARLHARVAAALERHHPREVAALAHHFVAAGGTNPAATNHHCRLAAGEAQARLSCTALCEGPVAECFPRANGLSAADISADISVERYVS